MRLSFRRLDRDAPIAPDAGTLCVLPKDEAQARRLDLARLALESGPDGTTATVDLPVAREAGRLAAQAPAEASSSTPGSGRGR